MKHKIRLHQHGLTLLELTVVLLILIALAGLTLPFLGGTGQFAQCTATETSLRAIRDAIVGSFEKPGYFEDMAGLPGNLRGLLDQDYCVEDGDLITQAACTGAGNTWDPQADYNPVTRRGWRGPYLSTNLDDAFDLNPILLQTPTQQTSRLVSSGPDETLQDLGVSLDANPRGDDRVLFLFSPDPRADLSSPCTETL